MKAHNIFFLPVILLLNGCFPEKHIEFNVVPVNGNIEKFSDELIKKGFTKTQATEDNQVNLKGDFLEKECEIYVYGTKKSRIAYKVTVNLPVEVHDSIDADFGKMQKLFATKYGKGMNRYQQYQNSERFLFNEPKRIRHTRTGDFTRYRTDSGTITLEVNSGYISITFLDKVNDEINKAESDEGLRQRE